MIGAILVLTSASLATFDSGSDGSDGAFNPQFSVVINLADAATGSWDTPSPVPGNGVYDPQQWAVVFKYTTIDIPPKVIVTFKNHPSGAPVIWLASGAVNIDGMVNLNGSSPSPLQSAPSYSAPGPGGFSGGVRPTGGTAPASGGFGPGGGNTNSGGSYSAEYGNANIVPLIGGSGGGGTSDGGGSGGGAILIASSDVIALGPAGSITANGGSTTGVLGGAGSGGSIRMIANSVSGQGQLRAIGGAGFYPGQDGRIRIDADMVTLTDLGLPNWISSFAPMPVFPAANAPVLQVTTIGGQSASTDPAATIYTTETILNTGLPVTVGIEARNIPAGTTVSVRIVPARGAPFTVTSTPLVLQGGGVLTATATVTFPSGKSEIQLRANWTP